MNLTTANTKIITTKNSTTTQQPSLEGIELSKSNPDLILKGFDKALNQLHSSWIKMNSNYKKKLPIIKTESMGLTFLLYLFISILKDFSKYKAFIKLIPIFYVNYLSKNNSKNKYTIAHRDLTPENILLTKQNKINIIDFEVASVANKLTDIALFPRFYIEYLRKDQIVNYLKSKLKDSGEKAQFLWLTIFYTLQFMAIENKESRYYKEAVKYLDLLQYSLIPTFSVPSKSIAEHVYFFILKILKKFNVKNRGEAKRLIVCYHSIDNSNWRFSTPVNRFKEQIKFLKNNFRVVSLDELLSSTDSKENLLAITFDDGYEDILTNAFPILKSLGLTATVFVIGNESKSNKKVLGNNKKMLTNKQQQLLKSAGWTIGYHTKSHSSLKNLHGSKLLSEIRSNFNYFAYPNGYYNEEIIKAVQKSGYKYSFTIDGGYAKSDNMFLVNRLPMEGKIEIEQFKVLFSTFGVYFSKIFMTLLKFKEYNLKPIFTP